MRPTHIAPLLLATLALGIQAKAAESTDAPANPAPIEGRLSPVEVTKVCWTPKAWKDPVKVAQANMNASTVKAGADLVQLDARDLDTAIADAKQALEIAQRQHAWAGEELQMLPRRQAAAKAEAAAALANAAEELKYWNSQARAADLDRRQLELTDLEHNLTDAKEEMNQLQAMYKESRIDNQTQSLVVGRAKRDIEKTERSLALKRLDLTHWIAFDLPELDGVKARAVESARLRWDLMESEQPRELQRAQDALVQCNSTLERARRRLADLQADAAALHMQAPSDGHLEPTPLKQDDSVAPGQEIARIFGGGWKATFDLDAKTATSLKSGDAVKVEVPDLDLTMEATVDTIAWEGRIDGSRTVFAAKIKILKDSVALRPNLKARLLLSK